MDELSPQNANTVPISPVKSFPSVTLTKQPGVLFNAGSLGTSSIDVHTIKLKVTLYHNEEKQDLTPYILQVKTHKGMGEPTGRFTLLLTFQKRWDAYIQAQDYIEISFSRYAANPPLIMRGLVSNVRRTRIVDSGGKVHRAITVNGEDFGKIWSRYAIEYLVQEPGQTLQGTDVNPINADQTLMMNMLTENYGIGVKDGDFPNKDLFQGMMDKMLNPYISYLQQVNPNIPKLLSKINVQDSYTITGLQIQPIQNMTAYAFMNQFSNNPWCEFFIDDFSEGPIMFYRDTPFKNENGDFILGKTDDSYFAYQKIADKDVIEEDVGKSDNEAFSYFFTYPALSMFNQEAPKATILGIPITFESETDTKVIYNPHVDMDNLYRFGFKDLQIASNSISVTDGKSYIEQSKTMNKWLVEAFVWSHKMLNGTIRMKGNEDMRIGRYVVNTSTNEEYYIESIDHDIVMSQAGSLGNDGVVSFQTSIGITRGRNLG